jgi:uncharacterized membrane protein
MTHAIHVKGTSAYTSSGYEESLGALRDALMDLNVDLVHIANHEATNSFPRSVEELAKYDAVVLSDIPADTLLLHPDTYLRSQRTPNLFHTLGEWVSGGGGMAMIGGYMSFAGFEGKARYFMTGVKEYLPVEMMTHDDRVEVPEGVTPVVVAPDHPVLKGLPSEWPYFLGYNLLRAKPGSTVLLQAGQDPFLTVGPHGKGRVAAFASDISPHWAPPEFLGWSYYGRFWMQLFGWLSGR